MKSKTKGGTYLAKRKMAVFAVTYGKPPALAAELQRIGLAFAAPPVPRFEFVWRDRKLPQHGPVRPPLYSAFASHQPVNRQEVPSGT